MSCEYQFIPGPESCTVETRNLTLGRTTIADASGDLTIRTTGTDAFNQNLNGATIITTWQDINGDPISPSDPQSIAGQIEFVNVVITSNGSEVFNETFPQTASYDVQTMEFEWVQSAVDPFQQTLNTASTSFCIPNTDNPTSVSSSTFPDHLPQGTYTVSGIVGLPLDASNIRTGPLGAILYIQQEQDPDVSSTGDFITVNSLQILNTDTCEWEDLNLP